MSIFWYVCNIGIAAGYYVLALSLYRLLSQFMRINWAIKVGAFFFFATCALTHLEHAYHLYAEPYYTVHQVSLTPHSLIIHGVQVVAVWTFLLGVLAALSKTRGLDRQTVEQLQAEIAARQGERRQALKDRRSP
jgi:uncharacterized membrane protein (DUF106 family)